MSAERMPEGMYSGFSDPCFRVVLFDQFPDTAWIQRCTVSGEKERLDINNVCLPFPFVHISQERPFEFRHEWNRSLLFPLAFSHCQLIMNVIDIVNF